MGSAGVNLEGTAIGHAGIKITSITGVGTSTLTVNGTEVGGGETDLDGEDVFAIEIEYLIHLDLFLDRIIMPLRIGYLLLYRQTFITI